LTVGRLLPVGPAGVEGRRGRPRTAGPPIGAGLPAPGRRVGPALAGPVTTTPGVGPLLATHRAAAIRPPAPGAGALSPARLARLPATAPARTRRRLPVALLLRHPLAVATGGTPRLLAVATIARRLPAVAPIRTRGAATVGARRALAPLAIGLRRARTRGGTGRAARCVGGAIALGVGHVLGPAGAIVIALGEASGRVRVPTGTDLGH
jgi:hypothetical protein